MCRYVLVILEVGMRKVISALIRSLEFSYILISIG
jgi:hypothetical protein